MLSKNSVQIKLKFKINFLFCLFPLIASNRLSYGLYSTLCNVYCTQCDVGTVLLNPKQNKAKLLGWALLSQNPTSSISTSSGSLPPVSHLLPRPTEKNQLLGPHKRYWSEILRISSNSPNLIFGLVLVNPIGSSN